MSDITNPQGQTQKQGMPTIDKSKKIMMISFDFDKWVKYCQDPKNNPSPDVEVMADFLNNKIMCYAMLEMAKEAIFKWNELQMASHAPKNSFFRRGNGKH